MKKTSSNRSSTTSSLPELLISALLGIGAFGACDENPPGTGGSNGPPNGGDAGPDSVAVCSPGTPVAVPDSATSTLKLVAGRLGGSGTSDGVGSEARFSMPWSITTDGAGNLFVLDRNSWTIRKVDIATGAVCTLAGSPGRMGGRDGVGAAATFSLLWGVTSDGAGNLFVADYSTIRKVVIATGAVTTLAGLANVVGTTDGKGSDARFDRPWGVATDGEGNLFVADYMDHTIRKVVIATGMVTTIAGLAGIPGSADGIGMAARFNNPEGVATDGSGNLFVADHGNRTLRKVVLATGAVTTFAGLAGYLYPRDGVGTDARFNFPSGVAYDGAGNLFVTDSATVRKVDLATGAVTTLAGSMADWASTDGTGTAARFSSRLGLTSDSAGNLFVADSDNSTVRKIDIATATVSTLAGAPVMYDSTDGVGLDARFHSPHGLASDGAGHLFVADSDNHTIRQVAIATGAVTTLAGSAKYPGTSDGVGPAAHFNNPMALVADSEGNLFVADKDNNTIRKVVIASRSVTTLAGAAGNAGSTDGVGPAARFAGPVGIATDGAGNLFVADRENATLRKIVIATGAVTTLAGSAKAMGSEDGTGPAARFNTPGGVLYDGAGSLFVADLGTNKLRKVDVATGAVTTVACSRGSFGYFAENLSNFIGMTTDGAGHLFVADHVEALVSQVAIATGCATTVVGSRAHYSVVLGPLPAQLRDPAGLVFVPPNQLFIADAVENVILVAKL